MFSYGSFLHSTPLAFALLSSNKIPFNCLLFVCFVSANNIAEARQAAHDAFLNELDEAEERYNNDHTLKDNMEELMGV